MASQGGKRQGHTAMKPLNHLFDMNDAHELKAHVALLRSQLQDAITVGNRMHDALAIEHADSDPGSTRQKILSRRLADWSKFRDRLAAGGTK